MKKVLVLLAVLSLAGCDDGGSGSVYIKDADVVNADSAAFVAGLTTVDTGVVSRGTLIEATISVANSTSNPWTGTYGMVFNVTCDDVTYPDDTTCPITLPFMNTIELPPGGTWSNTVGAANSAMPLGDHTLTATLYEADGVTVKDQVVVNFTLVE